MHEYTAEVSVYTYVLRIRVGMLKLQKERCSRSTAACCDRRFLFIMVEMDCQWRPMRSIRLTLLMRVRFKSAKLQHYVLVYEQGQNTTPAR